MKVPESVWWGAVILAEVGFMLWCLSWLVR